MKISMVSEHASPLATLGGVDAGGQNVHVAALAQSLGERGHDVTVFTRRDSTELPETVDFADRVKVVHVEAGPPKVISKDDMLPFMPALGRGMASYWGQHPDTIPDVVHTHFWMSGLAGREALKAAGLDSVPLVHTFHALGTVKRRHQGVLDTSPPDRVHLEPQVGFDSTHIIATCNDEVRELEAMGIDTAKTSVVPCGVDLRLFRPDVAPEETYGTRRIVSVGRLVARKGMDIGISALAHLARRGYDDVELHIIGGGSSGDLSSDTEAMRLMDVASELGVSDRVVLRGHVPRADMPSVFRSASLVACTPWYEPFGIVPLEAMACGVPVVAAKVGGLADTVVDGLTGLHVPPHSPEAVATAAALLLDNPDLAEELGKHGIERARERYAWPQVARDTEQVFLKLCADNGAAATWSDPIDDFVEFDRIERARRRDRALRDDELRLSLAARVDEARARQVWMRGAGEDLRVRRTQL
ncbi:glycosyltransferase [Flaviflexus huanghaiensis]|uniref:glycosyltransferase n=1 Tax=Flaviflexus huanghaiensis TaxID=1111473 RepID=UPI0015F8A5A9|nr:glycosyltransferase [Flaviflexus huanghaiensis]